MKRYNATEKRAFELHRHMTINGDAPAVKEWKLYWCGSVQFKSQYYGHCVAERNRLIAAGYKLVNFKISQ